MASVRFARTIRWLLYAISPSRDRRRSGCAPRPGRNANKNANTRNHRRLPIVTTAFRLMRVRSGSSRRLRFDRVFSFTQGKVTVSIQRADSVDNGGQESSARTQSRHFVRPETGPVVTDLHVSPGGRTGLANALAGRELGPFSYVHSLQLSPSVVQHGFHYQARGGGIGDLMYADSYSDTLSGISGNGPGNDPLVAYFVVSGWARFENEEKTVTVHPGQVAFKDTTTPWRFTFGPGTKSRTLIVPRSSMVGSAAPARNLPRILVADGGLAEVRLLTGYLDLARRFGDDAFSSFGRGAGQEAGVQLLFAAMGAARAVDAVGYFNVTVAAARRFIDEHLDDPNLAPPMVAGALHMSVRTLYRAFEDADEPIMAYVRRQRLRRARTELTAHAVQVSDVAARWQFSDTSHFIRHFKAAYGMTPAAYMKEQRTIAR